MNLHCLSFFQSPKIKIMSDSCHFHGTFTYKPYLGTACQNLLEKSSKKSVLIFNVFPNSFMALAGQVHGRFIADSCQFLSVPKNQNHVRLMSLSWQFHGIFTYRPYLGTVCQNLIGKSYPKSRCWLSICFFCLISASFLAICQIHVGFMALSSFWFLLFFQTVSWHLHGRFMAGSWHFHGAFMALSWHFSLWACLDLQWKCHESAKRRWNLHVRFMSICVYLSSVFFFDVIFIDGFWGSGWSIFSGVFFDQNIGL